MSLKELQDFVLVGGTALALQKGHRISVDLELFTQNDFIPAKLFESLTYFDDADIEPDPVTTEKSDWNHIKNTIIIKTNEYAKALS